ncbi:MAG: hypothetical protein ABSC49_02650 [Candidatus Microgenomates bacterium]|jgi:hypothetical protein
MLGNMMVSVFLEHVAYLPLLSIETIWFLIVTIVFCFYVYYTFSAAKKFIKYIPTWKRLKLTDQTLVEASLCQAANNFMRRIKRGNPGYDQASELIKKIYIAIRMDYTTESINSIIKYVDNSLFCCVDETFPNEPRIRLFYLAKSKYPLDDFYIKLCELPKKVK